jgi:phosphoribosylformimino-5-aminoimidazole carboxamide ribotide isomerase|tara:strand:+ start:6610 stop:7398 length:789 start_codon:yes stop_codon:yes gene_type:complete
MNRLNLIKSKTMRIIPAIDIIDGKCVRLTKGDYSTKKIYNEHPLEVAKTFEAAGINYLHVVDLDGAKASQIINYRVLEQIASKTRLKIDFGGGLKSNKDVEIAFNSGANQITGGSIAVKNRELFASWIEKYGVDKVILGADFYPDTSGGKIATNGWQEESTLELIPFILRYQQKGISSVICTDISKDGMLSGPSFEVYKNILTSCTPDTSKVSLKLIASGGISAFDELPLLATMGCEGVIIGKAIYEKKISLKQLEQYILNN